MIVTGCFCVTALDAARATSMAVLPLRSGGETQGLYWLFVMKWGAGLEELPDGDAQQRQQAAKRYLEALGSTRRGLQI
jgi:hypothetical protein